MGAGGGGVWEGRLGGGVQVGQFGVGWRRPPPPPGRGCHAMRCEVMCCAVIFQSCAN